MARYQLEIADLDRWEKVVKKQGLAVTRAAIRMLADRIIDDAPVDTGFMVESAVVELNPSGGRAPIMRPDGFWEPQARERKMDQVQQHTSAMQLSDTFGLSFIANYTRFVHEGTSKQASQPFVDINVAAWPSIVRQAVAAHKKR